ncbi:protein PAL OF QUIRKY-like [Lotus japonicus]|uniref:protein PAL OF QUIRKY-like n=1 Tax=Lotus japonicus TaxID=34305 RepID=UPI002589E01B|nr:protein PAL OF QUIRKY-like [Lotus japonicus]
MENYAPAYPPSYPDSGESSPRSREIDFENPPPWDDQNYKVKFMCSYGGKIQPRTHDNQLSYVGGDTKILAVDRNIKFPALLSKLSALCNNCDNPADLTFKYQLPGEDLDALISVTNDDDLDHMMHEYDRLYRASARPSRMRLFLFLPENPLPSALAPAHAPAPVSDQPDPVKPNNVDFLFGLDKPVAAPPPLQPPPLAAANPVPPPVAVPPPEYHQPRPNSDRVMGSDPGVNHHIEIQRQLQRLQVAESEQGPYRRRSEDNHNPTPAGNYDYYAQKAPEKLPASNFPVSAPPPNQAGYWQQEKAVSGEVYHSGGGDQPVYMIPGTGTFYHAPMVRPPVSQGYYAMPRLPSDVYREQQPVYGGVPPPKAPHSSAVPVTYPPAQPVKAPAYTEGVSVVRQAGLPDNTAGAYAQVAYDSATGRHVYYTAPGGVVHAPPYQGVAPPGSTDLRPPGMSLGQDVKVINKVSQGSV